MMKKIIYYFIVGLMLLSCKEGKTVDIERMIKEWSGKVLNFPSEHLPYLDGNFYYDSISVSGFKIVSYVDSIGCTSCKLNLNMWKNLITEFDSIDSEVSFLFYIHPGDAHELKKLLKREKFEYPVCIDENDEFNKLNNFPSDVNFHTFLIDQSNKIVAIGNPAHNPKIRELYLKIIRGEKVEQKDKSKVITTTVNIEKTSVLLGNFDWQKEQRAIFVLKNTGDKPLVIEDVNTSCGCISVNYSKEPVRPSGEVHLEVLYKADHPEHFSKTITVYCNSESSPVKLTISGSAQ